jgi:hypothetical protein
MVTSQSRCVASGIRDAWTVTLRGAVDDHVVNAESSDSVVAVASGG